MSRKVFSASRRSSISRHHPREDRCSIGALCTKETTMPNVARQIGLGTCRRCRALLERGQPSHRLRRPDQLRAKSTSSNPAGKTGGDKPIVLEKPARFNPPSHGSRLPRNAGGKTAPPSQHYGGELSAAEKQAQARRDYPGMMSPEGTWSHWLWNSRGIHLFITLVSWPPSSLYTYPSTYSPMDL